MQRLGNHKDLNGQTIKKEQGVFCIFDLEVLWQCMHMQTGYLQSVLHAAPQLNLLPGTLQVYVEEGGPEVWELDGVVWKTRQGD